MRKVAIVTGGSSGIGKAVCIKLAENGYKVYEFSRSGENAPGIEHCTVDLRFEDMVKNAVAFVLEKESGIDLLVSNAGYGIAGTLEHTESVQSHQQMETNLWGMDYVIRCVLPSMRAKGKGRIVCVSSVAGVIPIPFQAWYSISKAAINAYCLTLQNEVRPYGITVCCALPGDTHTGFTAARKKSVECGDYQERMEKSLARMEKDELDGMSAEEVGEQISDLAMKEKSPVMNVIGTSYKALALLYKLLPMQFANWLVGKLYA